MRRMLLCLGLVWPTLVLSATQVVMLGTGTPIPTPERAGPATAIVVDGKAYWWILAPVSYGAQLRFLPNMGGRWRL